MWKKWDFIRSRIFLILKNKQIVEKRKTVAHKKVKEVSHDRKAPTKLKFRESIPE